MQFQFIHKVFLVAWLDFSLLHLPNIPQNLSGLSVLSDFKVLLELKVAFKPLLLDLFAHLRKVVGYKKGRCTILEKFWEIFGKFQKQSPIGLTYFVCLHLLHLQGQNFVCVQNIFATAEWISFSAFHTFGHFWQFLYCLI